MPAASILQIRNHRERRAFTKPLFRIFLLDLLIICLAILGGEDDNLNLPTQPDQEMSIQYIPWYTLQYTRFTMTTILLIATSMCTLRKLNICLKWYFRLANVFYALTFILSITGIEMWIAGHEGDKEMSCAIIFGIESIPPILIVGLFLYHPLYGRWSEASRIVRRLQGFN